MPAIGYGNTYFGTAYSDEERAYCVDAWGGKEIWNTALAPFKNVCGTVTWHSEHGGSSPVVEKYMRNICLPGSE